MDQYNCFLALWPPGDNIEDDGRNKHCTNYYSQELDTNVDVQLKCQTKCLNFFKTYGNDCVGIVINKKFKKMCTICYDAMLVDVADHEIKDEYVFYRNNEGKDFVVWHI